MNTQPPNTNTLPLTDVEVTDVTWEEFVKAGGDTIAFDDTVKADFENSAYDDLRDIDL